MSNCECKTEKTAMFSGLSAFPLTPLVNDRLDESSFGRLIRRCVDANVDSICALGSTGNYAYLDREMRSRVAIRSVDESDGVPVIVGISALSTCEILGCAEDAQRAGADGLLLAPMSYQPLRDDEVFNLYETVSHSVSVPLCVYDNPTTTHFEFTDALLAQLSELPQVRSIKIPGLPLDAEAVKKRVSRLRALLATGTTIGISGDAYAGIGLNAGCDAWYSVIGGLFPNSPCRSHVLLKATALNWPGNCRIVSIRCGICTRDPGAVCVLLLQPLSFWILSRNLVCHRR